MQIVGKPSKIVAKTFEHLRYRYTFTDSVLGEVFAQHEFDEFMRVISPWEREFLLLNV